MMEIAKSIVPSKELVEAFRHRYLMHLDGDCPDTCIYCQWEMYYDPKYIREMKETKDLEEAIENEKLTKQDINFVEV